VERTSLKQENKMSVSTQSVDIKKNLRSSTLNWQKILGMTVGILIVLFILLPLLPLLIWSVGSRWFYPDLLPSEISTRAWSYVFSETSRAMEALWEGTAIALVATALSMIVSVPAGRALGLHTFRGKRLVQFLILAPTIVPVLAVAMGIHIAFIRYGLADSVLGVILVHLIPTTPYTVMVMSSVFSNYDPEYEEQARTLGAGPLRTFLFVTFPTIFPGLLVAGMFAFIISWGQYILTLLIGGGRVVTLPLLLFSFASSGDNSVTAALSVVYLVPALIILVITSKYLTGESAAMGGFGS
jgi:putative spermidine/putrescine transport system permease protein